MRRFGMLVQMLLILVLSACSLSAAPEAPPIVPPRGQGSTTNNPTAQPGGQTADPAQRQIITFGALENDRSRFAPLIERFNRDNPGIEVRFVAVDSSLSLRGRSPTIINRRLSAIASAADTALLSEPFPGEFIHPALADLQPLIDADPTFDRADFAPAVLPNGGAGLRILPLRVRIPLLAYNRDLWTQRGLAAPQLDWSWPDLLAAAQRLAERQGDTIETYGLLNSAMESHAVTALAGDVQAGGTAVLGPGVAPDALGQVPAEQVASIAQLIADGALPMPFEGYPDDVSPRISAGQAGIWPIEWQPTSDSTAFQVGVVPFPAGSAPAPAVVEGVVISNGTQHRDAAWRWLAYLSRQPLPLADPLALPNLLPARTSVATADPAAQQRDADVQQALDVALKRQVVDATTRFADQQMIDALHTVLRQVASDQQQPAVALEAAQTELARLRSTAPFSSPPAIVVATPPPAAASNIARVRFEVAFTNDPTLFPEAVRRFNAEHPEIEVTTTFNSGGGDSSLEGIASRADCFVSFGPSALSQTDAVLDLQPLIDADASLTRDDFLPGVLGLLQRDQQQVGLPLAGLFPLLGFNRALFDARGVEYPRPDWSAQDVLEAARRLTDQDGSTPTFGFVYADGEDIVVPYFAGLFKAELFRGQDAQLAPNFTDPAVIQALQAYLQIMQTSTPIQRLSVGWNPEQWNQLRQVINGGQAGMWITAGEWGRRSLQVPDTAQWIAPPLADGGVSISSDQLIAMYISARSPHSEACWTLIKALTNDVALVSRLGTPVRLSMGQSPDFAAAAPSYGAEVFQVYRDALTRSTTATPNISRGLTYPRLSWLYQALDQTLQGKNLEQQLDEAQVRTTELLRCLADTAQRDSCVQQLPSAN